MSTVGFCLVTNVEGHSEEELLKANKAFHALPIDVKMKMAPKHLNKNNKNIYHGYFPFIEGDPSHKEFYDMPRPFEDISQWEREGCPLYEFIPWVENDECGEHKWILDTFQSHFKAMHKLAMTMI